MRHRTNLLATIVIGMLLGGAAFVGRAIWAEDAAKGTERKPGDALGIDSLKNLRDIGGYPTKDGLVVRTGLLYRSNAMCRISDDDKPLVEKLALKSNYDLRRVEEREKAPVELPAGVLDIWINVMAESKVPRTPEINGLLADPQKANVDYGSGKMEARFFDAYRDYVSSTSGRASYRRLYTDLMDEKNLPAVVHCSSGKDRTGWAVAALLALLGVPREVIVQDYLRSNDHLIPSRQEMIDKFVAGGGEKPIMTTLLGVHEQFLEASFDEVKTKYGTIEVYFAQGLEIDASGQQKLKNQFLAKPTK